MSSFEVLGYYYINKLESRTQETATILQKSNKTKSNTRTEFVFTNEMICRVCTNFADIPTSNKVGNLNIVNAIRIVANTSTLSHNYYPKFICESCFGELKVALEFKRKCEVSDLILRKSPDSKTIVVNKSTHLKIHDFEQILYEMKYGTRKEKKTVKEKKEKSDSEKNTDSFSFDDEDGDSIGSNYEPDDNDFEEKKPKTKTTKKKVIKKKNKTLSLKTKKKNNIIKTSPKKRKPYCRRCDILFDSKDLLMKHIRELGCVKPCVDCGRVVKNLVRHRKVMHIQDEKFPCHVCGRIFFSSGGLRNHLLVHSDKCEYACNLCSYKGKQKSYLKVHMRVHTGEHPYLCSQCPLKFLHQSNFRKHMRTHSGQKYECEKCKKQFRYTKSLNEHYNAAHLNIRYQCNICSLHFWTRKKLLAHELRVHNREKHKLFQETKVIIRDDND